MVAMHFHDTHKHALDNIKTSLDMGIHSYDSSVGGLGGCPYAQGATGNVSTQEVVELLHSLGYETGIDTDKLNSAYQAITDIKS
jgi:hydroxymethylglutaryl-CoA lyase